MARYDSLLQDVRPYANEALVPEVEDNIRRAVITFCRRSRIWRPDRSVTLKANEAEYPVRITDGRLDQVLRARYKDDKNQYDLKQGDFKLLKLGSDSPAADRPQQFALNPTSGKLLLYPTPTDVTDNPVVELVGVAVPTRDSQTFPDFILEEWYDGLVHGALWYLLTMPNKPWTQHELAMRERQEFFTAINNARREAITSGWMPKRVPNRRWR